LKFILSAFKYSAEKTGLKSIAIIITFALVRTKMKNKIALFLATIFSLALIQPETFHHHEEDWVVCKEGEKHVESKRFECQLKDVVLPQFINAKNHRFTTTPFIENRLKERLSFRPKKSDYNLPFYRGPPFIV